MALENDFLAWATAAGANVESQQNFASDPELATGVASGKASSAQANKLWRQHSMWAVALGLFLNDQGQNAIDDGVPSNLKINLEAALTSFVNAAVAASSTFANFGNIVVIQEQQPSGTNAGNFSAINTWNVRNLNTKVADTKGICTLSSKQFTLPAGTYYIDASSTASDVDDHAIRLNNVTDGVILGYGTHEQTTHISATDVNTTKSRLTTIFTINAAKTFEIDHACTGNTGISEGWGMGFGQNLIVDTNTYNVFSEVVIQKIG